MDTNIIGKYDDQVMAAVSRIWGLRFRPPTIREIMAEVGIPSSSHTAAILKKLGAAGFLMLTSRGPVPWWVVRAIEAKRQSIIGWGGNAPKTHGGAQ